MLGFGLLCSPCLYLDDLGVTSIASASPFTASVEASPMGMALNVATNSVYMTIQHDTVSVFDSSTYNATTG